MADNDSSVQKAEERTWQQKIQDYWVNDGPKLVFIILWICGNVAFLIDTYIGTFPFKLTFLALHIDAVATCENL
jgi:hypothetical protein